MNPQDPRYSSGVSYQPPHPDNPPTPPAQKISSQPMPNAEGGFDVIPAPQRNIPSASNGGHNPYEFIVAQTQPQSKQSIRNGSTIKKIILFFTGLAVLIVLAIVAFNYLVPKDPTLQVLTSNVQEQHEILRVTALAISGASNSDLKDFLVNTDMTIRTDKTSTLEYLATQKITIPQKELGLKTDSTISKLFSDARATNRQDVVKYETMHKILTTYRNNLNTAYASATNVNAKNLLKTNYDHVSSLLTQADKIEL